MKPFVINRQSWHYKFNRFMTDESNSDSRMILEWEPKRSNFCSYWRTTIFNALGVLTIFSLLGIILYGIGRAFILHTAVAFTTLGIILALVAFIVGFAVTIVYIKEWNKKIANSEAVNESLFVQKYKVHKSKICPNVEFK